MKKLVPVLRFPEFEENNRSEKIKNVTSYVDYRGKTPTKTEGGVFLVTAKNIKDGYIDYSASSEYISVSEYNLVMRRGIPKIDDVLITTEAPLGNVASIDREDIALAQRVIKYRGEANILDNRFLKFYFLSESFQAKLLINATGSTALGIKGSILHNLDITFPSLPEQTKIAEFLTAIDKRIELLTTKKEELTRYKKGVMQKIFNQEIRFKPDEGEEFPDWEEKYIEDVCSVDTGNRDTKDRVDEGVYPFFVRSDNVERIDSFSFDGEAILTSGDGVGVGKNFHYINGKFNYHQRVYCLKNFRGADGKYVFYFFSDSFYARVMRLTAKNSVDSVRREMITKMSIPVPSIEEQGKIANFLTSLDLEIQKVEQQITLNRTYKKGLLQQMFV